MAKKIVLVVDDQPGPRFVWRSILEGEGLSVVEAESGKEAFKIINQQNFVLIVSDIKMSSPMDGIEFLNKTKKLNSDILFILTSGGHEWDRDRALSFGADDFIAKPAIKNDIINCIKKYLG
ncbi:MAG: response regulator [Candidatus Brocadiales bacterium]|nr:response regulator [Candidatus Brocadiales bacterium]